MRRVQNDKNMFLSLMIQNIFQFIIFSKVRFGFDRGRQLYFAAEMKEKHYFGDMKRGFDFYFLGIQRRGDNLLKSYCLNTDIFTNDNDIVIDCGANYGDLSIALRNCIDTRNYISFEPGPTEHSCIQENVPLGRNFQIGLSNYTGETKFYIKSDTGDSSILEIEQFAEIVPIEVITLDDFVAQHKITTCKLLKLEAEGMETEILEGAKNFLKTCEFVAVDCGFERGLEQAMTFPAVNTILLDNGFELIDINLTSVRALYSKRK